MAPRVDGAPVLAARGVTKTYWTGTVAVPALRGVDLLVGRGEFVAVMGPSGSGKTTLLNCLSGLDEIDGGSVLVDGEDIHAMPDARRTAHRARHMGFIFQSFNLIPVFSAEENVELPLLLVGRRPAEARARAREVGMLRAMGVPSALVRGAFLAESAFVAARGLMIGAGLSLLSCWLLVTRSDALGADRFAFSAPWGALAALLALTLVAAVACTLVPAERTSRIRPAAALRVAD